MWFPLCWLYQIHYLITGPEWICLYPLKPSISIHSSMHILSYIDGEKPNISQLQLLFLFRMPIPLIINMNTSDKAALIWGGSIDDEHDTHTHTHTHTHTSHTHHTHTHTTTHTTPHHTTSHHTSAHHTTHARTHTHTRMDIDHNYVIYINNTLSVCRWKWCYTSRIQMNF